MDPPAFALFKRKLTDHLVCCDERDLELHYFVGDFTFITGGLELWLSAYPNWPEGPSLVESVNLKAALFVDHQRLTDLAFGTVELDRNRLFFNHGIHAGRAPVAGT